MAFFADFDDGSPHIAAACQMYNEGDIPGVWPPTIAEGRALARCDLVTIQFNKLNGNGSTTATPLTIRQTNPGIIIGEYIKSVQWTGSASAFPNYAYAVNAQGQKLFDSGFQVYIMQADATGANFTVTGTTANAWNVWRAKELVQDITQENARWGAPAYRAGFWDSAGSFSYNQANNGKPFNAAAGRDYTTAEWTAVVWTTGDEARKSANNPVIAGTGDRAFIIGNGFAAGSATGRNIRDHYDAVMQEGYLRGATDKSDAWPSNSKWQTCVDDFIATQLGGVWVWSLDKFWSWDFTHTKNADGSYSLRSTGSRDALYQAWRVLEIATHMIAQRGKALMEVSVGSMDFVNAAGGACNPLTSTSCSPKGGKPTLAPYDDLAQHAAWYNVDLGTPIDVGSTSADYQVPAAERAAADTGAGFYRRRFTGGVAVVNVSGGKKTYVPLTNLVDPAGTTYRAGVGVPLNHGDAIVATSTADTTAPVIASLTASQTIPYSQTSATFTGSATDSGGSGLSRVEVSSPTLATTTITSFGAGGSFSYTRSGLPTGRTDLTFTVFDGAGNRQAYPRTVTRAADVTAPAITAVAPAGFAVTVTNATTTYDVIVGVSDSESGVASVTSSVNGASAVAMPATATPGQYHQVVSLVVGQSTVAVRATDAAGNIRTQNVVITRSGSADTTPPVIAASSPAVADASGYHVALSYGAAMPSLSGTATDNVGVASFTVNGSAATLTSGAWSYTPASLLPGATRTETIDATDAAGNHTHVDIVLSRAADTTPPSLTVTTPTSSDPARPVGSTTVASSGTVSDSESGVASLAVAVNGGAPQAITVAASWSVTVTGLAAGSNSLVYTATDNAGNAQTQTVVVIVGATGPPTVKNRLSAQVVGGATDVEPGYSVSVVQGLSTSDWNDTTAVSVQTWQRCTRGATGVVSCTNIPGTGGVNPYVIDATAVPPGNSYYVAALLHASGPGGTSNQRTNLVGPVVSGSVPIVAGTPVASGDTTDGGTISVTPGSGWQHVGFYTYALEYRDAGGASVPTSETSPTHVNTTADASASGGREYRWAVTGHASGVPDVTAFSNWVGPISLDAPTNVAAPGIVGIPQVGVTNIVASPGGWTGSLPIVFTFAWYIANADGSGATVIAGATDDHAPPPTSDMIGKAYVQATTATNAAGSVTALSAPSSPILPAAVDPGSPLLLGCGRWDVYVLTRGGTRIAAMLPWTTIDAARVLDDTSQATVTLNARAYTPAGSQCCDALRDVRAFSHELALYRDGQLEWVGPINADLSFQDESVTIPAGDLSAWWAVRQVHESHSFDDDADVSDSLVAIIDDAMAPDESPNLSIDSTRQGLRAAYTVSADAHRLASDVVREIAEKGADWTVYRRVVMIGHTRQAPTIATLFDHHFSAPPEITDGGTFAGRWVIIGQGEAETSPSAASDDADSIAEFGLVERVRQVETATVSSVADLADRYSQLYSQPAVGIGPDATLDPSAPVRFPDLVPGGWVIVNLSDDCRPVARTVRLVGVKVTASATGESVAITTRDEGELTEQ